MELWLKSSGCHRAVSRIQNVPRHLTSHDEVSALELGPPQKGPHEGISQENSPPKEASYQYQNFSKTKHPFIHRLLNQCTTPIIPTLGRGRQEDQKFRVTPDYIESSRLALATLVYQFFLNQTQFILYLSPSYLLMVSRDLML